jgi:hypothetical protein
VAKNEQAAVTEPMVMLGPTLAAVFSRASAVERALAESWR